MAAMERAAAVPVAVIITVPAASSVEEAKSEAWREIGLGIETKGRAAIALKIVVADRTVLELSHCRGRRQCRGAKAQRAEQESCLGHKFILPHRNLPERALGRSA